MNRSSSLSSLQKHSKTRNNVAKGAYLLVLWLGSGLELTVGKLGTIPFPSGFYFYIGSAMGPGGFKRVSRHLSVSAKLRNIQKWHVDSLLRVSDVVRTIKIATNSKIECRIAQTLLKNPFLTHIRGFGSSDCKCLSHLFYSQSLKDLESVTRELVYELYCEVPSAVLIVEGYESCGRGRCENLPV
jgi:Uri superfamily endonuclease